jgi:DNA-binding XRE family transcriptional regulator
MPRPLKPPNPYASWSALFGATVQKLRLSLRSRPVVTQEELGKLVHAAGSTVSAIERGILRPSASFVEKCEEVLPSGGMLRAMFRSSVRSGMTGSALGACRQQPPSLHRQR